MSMASLSKNVSITAALQQRFKGVIESVELS
ncbi:hypothetical protein T11_776 [Trichinella zimbabwensis]|uniref:Uncharacterized protein n=1 Tax=Trichinella zimbabwensis TaxID=268475 RepID=A0A0V1GAC4_9BILA|nr:hypothetical protein T11_776 [Trichinella zimbabwensis]